MTDLEATLKKWQSQLRKGALELCVLGLIHQEPTYAFTMIQALQENSGFTITEGALYPLLRRLQKDKQLEVFWVESDSGPPRKYYRLTDYGHKMLTAMQKEWEVFSRFVDQTLSPGSREQTHKQTELEPLEMATVPAQKNG